MKALVFATCMTALSVGGAAVVYALGGALLHWYWNLSDRRRAAFVYGVAIAALFGFFLALGLKA
jgi:hypothetical protein